MKFLIVLALFGIVASLGHALYSMSSGPREDKQMVQALTIRVILSVALFALLMIGWSLGFISPH
jgi:hypothetical protein